MSDQTPEPAGEVEASEPVAPAGTFFPPLMEISDIDDEVAAAAQPELATTGKRFFIGHVQLFKFPDGTEFHAKRNHVFVTDPVLIKNLTELSKSPHNHIFPED